MVAYREVLDSMAMIWMPMLWWQHVCDEQDKARAAREVARRRANLKVVN